MAMASEVGVNKSSDGTGTYNTEERIINLRSEIVRLIKDQHVLQHLIPHIISQESGAELKQLYKKCTKERANHRLLDLLLCSKTPGKWTAFIAALEAAEYTYLTKLLQAGDEPQTYQHQRRIIEIFAPYLEQEINPGELIDGLYSANVISHTDAEEISVRQRNDGTIAASMVLLERIQTHLQPVDWYCKFLQALLQNKNDDLVRRIDPDFNQNQEFQKCSKVADRIAGSFNKSEDVVVSRTDLTSRINECRDEIVKLVQVRDVVEHLVPVVISQVLEQRSELLNIAESHPVEATSKLLDHVICSKFHLEFLRALREADYSYLANLLSNPMYKCDCEHLRKIFQIFTPRIQQQLKPLELLSRLTAEGVLNHIDKEVIMSTHHSLGNTAATRVMLDCIQRRLEPSVWFTKFLHVLLDTGHSDVVEIIEPDFLKDPDQFSSKLFATVSNHSEDFGETRLKSITSNASSIDDAIADVERQERSLHESKEEAKLEILSLERNMFGFVRQEIEQKFKHIKDVLKKHKERLLEIKRNEQIADNRECEDYDDKIKAINKLTQYPRGSIVEITFQSSLEALKLKSIGKIYEVVSDVTDNIIVNRSRDTFGIMTQHTVQSKEHEVIRLQETASVKSSESSGFVHVFGEKEEFDQII